MMSTQKIFTKKVLAAAVAAAGLLAAVLLFAIPRYHATAAATVGGDIHGYAWSSTVGWVSLNCAEGGAGSTSDCAASAYKVTINPISGALSGDAWSSNVGWVSFNAADVTAACGTPASADISTGVITGWARVVSAAPTDATDGCISMAGSSPAYGVSVDPTTGIFSGYGWGSTNVGWLSFAYATMVPNTTTSTPPGVDLKASNDLVNYYDNPTFTALPGSTFSTNLKWTSVGVSSCVSSASPINSDWTNGVTRTTAGSTYVRYPGAPAVFNFTITCTPTDTVTYPFNVSDTVTITLIQTKLYVNGASTASLPYIGGGAKLTWQTAATAACTTSRTIPSGFYPPADWTGTRLPGAGASGQPITLPANTTTSPVTYGYSITCPDGSAFNTSSVTVTVAPSSGKVSSLSFNVDGYSSETVPSGTPVNLNWSTVYVGPGSCIANSSPTYPAWDATPIGTSSTAVPFSGTYLTAPLTADQDFTIIGCSQVAGGPLLFPQTVHVTVGPATATSTTTSGKVRRPPWQEF